MEKQRVSSLFSGHSQVFGGLSNECQLARVCPPQFKESDNAWSIYAETICSKKVDITKWKWKSLKRIEKISQVLCLYTILGTHGLMNQDTVAVAGWMLSEMLLEIPQ